MRLASDHLPTTVELKTREIKIVDKSNRTYVNLKKAGQCETEFTYYQAPSNINEGVRIFNQVLNRASKQHIPHGKIKEFMPGVLTPTAEELGEARDALRRRNPHDPQIAEYNTRINKLTQEEWRTKWREFVGNISYRTGVSELWSAVKLLNDKR